MKTYEDIIAAVRKVISQELARARPDLSKYALNSNRFLRLLAVAKFVGLEEELSILLDNIKVIDELQTISGFEELNRMALAAKVEKSVKKIRLGDVNGVNRKD